jgi:hypothetical protein
MRGSIAGLVFVIFGCDKDDVPLRSTGSGASPGAEPAAAAVKAKAEPEPEPEPPPATLALAIAKARPTMEDVGDGSISPGTLELVLWAASSLRWSDIAPGSGAETSIRLVMKDSDAARGKRLCSRGRIIQIQKEKGTDPPVFSGILVTSSYDLVHFYAVGSTGELVEKDRARICGVVTGRYSYPNAGGGTGHAVDVVGMFELPENTGKASR